MSLFEKGVPELYAQRREKADARRDLHYLPDPYHISDLPSFKCIQFWDPFSEKTHRDHWFRGFRMPMSAWDSGWVKDA